VTETQLFYGLLKEGAVGGAVLAVVAFLLSRFVRDAAGRSLLVIILFAAAGVYFGFAIVGGAGPVWTLLELGQVVAFGVAALRGLRGSPWWLAAGWALHPVWDALLHYVGPGRSFAPAPYAIACIGYDLVVAAYVALAYGLVGGRRLGFRGADAYGAP
jgi:hypothetical protein